MDALTAMKQALDMLEYAHESGTGTYECIDNMKSAIDDVEKLKSENAALSERLYRISIGVPQFATVYCSQCGGEFGPANSGYSTCLDHCKKPTEQVS